jgi:hypothetical protein
MPAVSASRQRRHAFGHRGRLVLLEEVLGRQRVDLI